MNLHNIVLSKYQKGDIPTDIHRHLKDSRISLATIKRWRQMIRQSATRYTCCSTDSHGTKENIQKVKNLFSPKASAGKRLRQLGISTTSIRRILKIDLGLKPCKNIIANHHFTMIKRSNGNNLQTGFEQIFEKTTP